MDISGSIPQIILYVVLLFAAAYFAAAESAFSSMNRVRVQLLADEGNKKAKRAIVISEKFDRAITSLLIGNNIAHIGCASLSTIIAIETCREIFDEGTATTVSTIVTTVIVFLFSEMIPKSFAKANAERVALSFAGSFTLIMKLLTPIALIFAGISRLFTMLFPAKEEPTYSEEELVSLIETVEEEGVIDEESSDILQSAIEFSSTTVKDVMTVRDDIFAIEVHTPVAEIKRQITESSFTRVPVYDTTIDKIVGIMNIRTFLKTYLQKKGRFNIRTILTRPCLASADSPIDELFDQMRRSKIYMAVVRDDIDATIGIATIEDFLEELVGEIWDEHDEKVEEIKQVSEKEYVVDGMTNISKVFDVFDIDDEEIEASNANGWAMEVLEKLPEQGDTFTDRGLYVEILETTGKRVESLKITDVRDSDEEEIEKLEKKADDDETLTDDEKKSDGDENKADEVEKVPEAQETFFEK